MDVFDEAAEGWYGGCFHKTDCEGCKQQAVKLANHFRSAVGGAATDTTAIRDAVQSVIKTWRVTVKSTWPPEPGQVCGTKVWCDEANKAVNSFADALDRSLKSTQQSLDAGRGGKS